MHLKVARELLAAGRHADLLRFIVEETPSIEASVEVEGLRPWFDARGTAVFIRIVFDAAENADDLYANLVAA